MNCPQCSQPYGLHLLKVDCYSGQDDYRADYHVEATRRACKTIYGAESINQPDHSNRKRELDAVLTFGCECCGSETEIQFLFHKGHIEVNSLKTGEWDINAPL